MTTETMTVSKLHFVKKSRKNYRAEGIKRGDAYWWFKHYKRSKVRCKAKPPRSAYSTMSPFLGALMDAKDELNRMTAEHATPEEFRDKLEELVGVVEELAEQCETSLEGSLAAFPGGCPTADLLQQRVEACRTLVAQLRDAASSIAENATEDDVDQALGGISWDYE